MRTMIRFAIAVFSFMVISLLFGFIDEKVFHILLESNASAEIDVANSSFATLKESGLIGVKATLYLWVLFGVYIGLITLILESRKKRWEALCETMIIVIVISFIAKIIGYFYFACSLHEIVQSAKAFGSISIQSGSIDHCRSIVIEKINAIKDIGFVVGVVLTLSWVLFKKKKYNYFLLNRPYR